MENYELLPTEDNFMSALWEDVLNRNKDIVYFYELLLAQDCAGTIAIDGRWGSGKTFFVNQSIMAINALNSMADMDEEKRARILCKMPFAKKEEEIQNSILTVYYDAWKNDNDIDPVISLVYEMTKQLSLTYNLTNKNIFKISAAIVDAFTGRSISGILDSLKSDDPLAKFKEQKNIEEKIKEFFSEILIERAERLVIFIDELDRCKPTFAVKLLEQIKHYLDDDRITFVFSVNVAELQHTIRHYYGDEFDACRYLDRFFTLRVSMPPADKSKFYNKMGLNSSYWVDIIIRRIIDMYHFELRDTTRFYRQVKTAVYSATHEGNEKRYDFSFHDGNGKQLILFCVAPLIIGLKIADITLHDEFINGRNSQPLKDLFDSEKMNDFVLERMLTKEESFENEDGKVTVSKDDIIERFYSAIFVNKYEGAKYKECLGEYEFSANSRLLALSAAGMMTGYADFSI